MSTIPNDPTTSDTLTPTVPSRGLNARGRLAISIRHRGKTAVIGVGTKAVAALGAPKAVTVLLSRSQIALAAAAPSDRTARRLYTNGEIAIGDLIDTLCLKPGDAFTIDLTVTDGRLVGDLPAKLFMRRTHEARKGVAA